MAYVDDQIQVLLRKYMDGAASAVEYQQLVELLKVEWESPLVEEVLLQQVQDSTYHQAEEEVNWSDMVTVILHEEESEKQPAVVRNLPHDSRLRSIRGRSKDGRSIWQWSAAAVLLLVLGSAAYFYFKSPKAPESIAMKPAVPADIAPGSDKAILTLADGRQIILDSTSGTVANEKGIKVINLAGQLRYQDSSKDQLAAVSYHTVTTPRGGQYQLVLEDGTRVWMNAASSLRFPTAFVGKDRVVELTGEAYFEVAHDASKPFTVKKGDVEVEVLGTHFNVNSYDDEEAIKVTLLEGSVKVANGGVAAIIKPGQQAVATSNYKLQTINSVDLESTMAWKNGFFSFSNADLKTIMRQAARWYDVDVSYEGSVPWVQFTGEIGRKLTLKQFLSILQDTRIHYRIEDKRLVITQ